MRRLARLCTRVAIFLGIVALSAPAAASGDLIYADPNGSVFFCSESQPCGIEVAINLKAQSGDEVLLAPGTYETSAELEIAGGVNDVTIRAADPAAPRPRIVSDAQMALTLLGANAVVRGIDIDHDNPGATGILALGNARIRNVVATSTGDTPCQLSNARLTDSICHATGIQGRALRVSLASGVATATVRNATLIADGEEAAAGGGIYATASGGSVVTVDVASSIIAGEVTDIRTATSGGGEVDVEVANSNFDVAAVAPGASVTPPGTAGNQTAAPIFTGPTFEQAAGSPTIDAGAVDAETGATDVYGDARPQGAANDIGADEFPVAAPPPDTTPPETTITRRPKRKSKKRGAKFAFASSEPGSTFECKLDKGGFEACGATLKLKRLGRRRHSLAVRATDAAGNVDVTPATFAWKVKRRRR